MKKLFIGLQLLIGFSINCLADPASISVTNHYALVAGYVTLPPTPPLYNILLPNLTFTPILTIYAGGGLPPGWVAAHPGYGIIVNSPNPITFQLSDPAAQVLPLALPAGFSLVCCQTNLRATFEMIVGRAPDPGTMLYRLRTNGLPNPPVDGGETNYTIYAFTNGTWLPQAPMTAVGEAVWVFQLPMISNQRITGTNFTFGALTGVGSVTAVEFTDSLTGTWQVLTNISGDGGIGNVLDPADVNVAQRFYRLNMKNNQN